MRFRYAIAVSGSHGKTTTTSLVASVLAEAGEDPTFVIGGRLKSADTNGRLGAGNYLVAEADESDASFMHLQPMIAVVTNIDTDHLGTYGGDLERLRQTFVEFLHNLPFYGLAVLCLDDPGVRRDRRRRCSGRRSPTASARAPTCARANIRRGRPALALPGDPARPAQPLDVTLNLPGRHNVLNALAAIALAHELELDDAALWRALWPSSRASTGACRCSATSRPATAQVLLVDDYGHHPTEIAATMRAAREAWPGTAPGRGLPAASLHPHAGSARRLRRRAVRRRQAAGRRGLRGRRGPDRRRRRPRHLPRDAQPRAGRAGVRAASWTDCRNCSAGVLQDGDVVLTLGAGDIGTAAQRLPAALARRPGLRRSS